MVEVISLHTPVSTRAITHPTLDELIARSRIGTPLPVAVCHPCSEVALRGAIEAREAGVIEPVLVAPQAELQTLAQSLSVSLEGIRCIDADDEADAAMRSVALCTNGQTLALMKGSLHTDTLMHAVMVGGNGSGLRGNRRLSHVYVMDAPAYPRTLLITDAAINIEPTLDDKVDIVQNAIGLAQALGIAEPRVAILSAVETVNPKIRSTIDAAALCKMAQRGQIHGAILDGPLAFDTAVSLEAATIKQLHSPVAGRADILVVPDLEAGNMLAKQLEYLGGAKAAGIVLGARVPIILTSRADTAKCRLASCAIAALYARVSPAVTA